MPLHEQRYRCCFCEAPAKIGEGEFIPTCLRHRTEMIFRPRQPWPDMPTDRPLLPSEIIARDAMLAAYRGA
jgi:hypothetical protein